MKETKFIDQNREKWAEFESLLNNKTQDPNRLSELYVQITDDLSFSKTYYKNRLIRAYLNNLSQKVYLSVYKNKKTPLSKLSFFWKEEIPFIFYQCRKELLISFIVFFFAALIGAFSVLNDPDYAEIVTSPSYVQMTKENIKNGDPMAVYKDEDSLPMFLRIAWNNIRVSFNVFALGVLAGVGTIMMLIMNGTMLGGFQFFFYDKGVFLESVVTVWQHGTIEILSIIIAGAAGIVLGKGFIAPGSYPRMQSFQLAARKGIIMMIAIMPFIVIAAFIEGYITRLTGAPLLFRVGMIVLSLLVMFGYFVYLPFIKNKGGFDASLKFERPIESKNVSISLERIKSSAEVFADAFGVFVSDFAKFFSFALLFAFIYGFLHLYYLEPEVYYFDIFDFWTTLKDILLTTFMDIFIFFKHGSKIFVWFMNVLTLTVLTSLSIFVVIKRKSHENFTFKRYFFLVFNSLFVCVVLQSLFFIDSFGMYLAFAFLFPAFIMLLTSIVDLNSIPKGISLGISILFTKFLESVFLWLMLFFIITAFSLINSSMIVAWLVDFISQNFLMEGNTIYQFFTFASAFLGIGVFTFILPIFIIAFSIQYFSLAEVKTASNLQNKISLLFSEK